MNVTNDRDWIRRSFMVPKRAVTGQNEVRRVMTSAEFKFTDTTLGGSFSINPPPQFTEYADIRVPGRLATNNGSRDGIGTIQSSPKGLGRYYSEALDDHGQYVHMRFGVPKFNSLTNFFFNFYNPQAAQLANRGRGSTLFYQLGKAIGFVISLPLQPVIWAGNIVRFLSNKPSSKFYYLKPAMPLYWNAVSTMINTIGVNMGLIGRGMSDAEKSIRGDEEEFFSTSDHNFFHRALPSIYREDGGIDIYAVATKAQRLAHRNRLAVEEMLTGSRDTGWNGLKSSILTFRGELLDQGPTPVFESYLDKYHASLINQPQENASSGMSDVVGDNHEAISEPTFNEFIMSELEDGSQFVTFRVDDPGPVSESFSNSVGESELAGKINSMSAASRSARFSFADGNIGSGLLSGAATGAINAVRDLVTGGLDQVKLSGLMALGGSAFVDIPKIWEDSSVNLPRSSYTIELRTPYGNPLSRFQNLIVPLAMILAGALPLSTGRQSYTSPFLCELYSKGRNQIRLGMIDSLSITRGTGNVGWTPNNEPLGIDISFSVVDLSTILHMPISSNFNGVSAAGMAAGEVADEIVNTIATAVGSTDVNSTTGVSIASFASMSNFDDDNAYTDYMAVLGSLSLADQIYPTNKLRLRRAIRMAKWEQWKSPARHANWLMGTSPGRMLSALTHITDRA